MKCHRLCGLKNRNFFVKVLEAGKSKVKMLAESVLGKGPLPALQISAFLLCPHVVERKRARHFLFL